jgi:hypothetical protein
MNISEEDRVVSLAKIAREDLEGSEDAGLTAEAKTGMAPAAEEGAGAPPTTEEELAEESETPPEE